MGALPTGALAYAASPHPATIAIAAVAGGVAFRPLAKALDGKRLPKASSLLPARKPHTQAVDVGPDVDSPGAFGLWIGEATGTFAERGHRAGLRAGSNVTLNLRDATKNLAIFGETGTGKTTRVVNHLLVQALDLDAGAFIFDIRGDFHETALRAAQLTGKTVQRIGVGQLGVNLLEGLTPNTAAGFLEAAVKLLGQGEGDSAFWLSLAVARCQNALGVLDHVPGEYSLRSLYRYVFDDRFRAAAIDTANEALLDLQVHAADGDRDASLEMRRLKGALDYETTIAPGYSEKERSGLNRTIETALARFTDPELEDAFCTANHAQARIEDLLDGAVFVVNVPRERFKAASRVVYLFLKERFFQALNARAQMPPGPRKERPVLFFCDEYQQICSAGDANFFDTSRALNVVGIVAAQSMEAYINATGDEQHGERPARQFHQRHRVSLDGAHHELPRRQTRRRRRLETIGVRGPNQCRPLQRHEQRRTLALRRTAAAARPASLPRAATRPRRRAAHRRRSGLRRPHSRAANHERRSHLTHIPDGPPDSARCGAQYPSRMENESQPPGPDVARYVVWLVVGLAFMGYGVGASYAMYTAPPPGGIGLLPLSFALFCAVTGLYIFIAVLLNLWLPKPRVNQMRHHRKISGALFAALISPQSLWACGLRESQQNLPARHRARHRNAVQRGPYPNAKQPFLL